MFLTVWIFSKLVNRKRLVYWTLVQYTDLPLFATKPELLKETGNDLSFRFRKGVIREEIS
jgi:hypothetical protein